MSRIVVAGHLCVDLTPRADRLVVEPGRLIEVGPLSIGLGGCVANTSRALAALGHQVRIATRVGDDDLGRIAVDLLTRMPGLTGRPAVAPHTGTSYSIVLEPVGVDRGFWHHVGANAAFDGDETDTAGAELVHVGYPSLLPRLVEEGGRPFRRLLERARTAGATTSVDLAVIDPSANPGGVDWEVVLASAMPGVDVISPSADDLRSALGRPNATAVEFVELLLGWGAAVVAVSDGSNGVTLGVASAARLTAGGAVLAPLASAWAGARVQQAALPLRRVLTTNGAGDAATAGLLSALVHGLPPDAALAQSAAIAAARIQGEPVPATSSIAISAQHPGEVPIQ